MFVRQFRIKSNVRLKNSERKKWRSQIELQYPRLGPVEIDRLCPPKDDLTQLRLLCHSGDAVTAYCVAGEPVFFDREGQLLPTVYALWRFPSLVPYLCTWDPVLKNLSGGADLMAPGIAACSADLAEAKPGDAVAVRLASSGDAAVAVGCLLVSPNLLTGPQRRGKAVAVAHVYGDCLWAQGSKTSLPKGDQSREDGSSDAEDELPADSVNTGDAGETSQALDASEVPQAVDHQEPAEKDVASPAPVEDEPFDTVEAMDALLEKCTLSALRSKLPLPLLASTLYSAHVLPRCPPGRTLQLKGSSHKKFSSYLAHLQNEGLLSVRESSPGVQSIVSVQREHPKIRTACSIPLHEAAPEACAQTGYVFPTIRELRTVTAAVKLLFPRKSKGDALSNEEIMATLRDYVRENELQDPDDKRMVRLDPVLSDVASFSGALLTWQDLISRVQSRMQHAHEVTLPGQQPTMHKGPLPPISLTVAQRTGNKKVTLVEGFETYGIDPQRLAHEVQVGVAASTSLSQVNRGGSRQVQQLLVQGNQVVFLERLLTGPTYSVPKKYLKGLENAPGKKKAPHK